jgi:hypothetical protein
MRPGGINSLLKCMEYLALVGVLIATEILEQVLLQLKIEAP